MDVAGLDEPPPQAEEPPHGSIAHAVQTIRPHFDAALYATDYSDVKGDAEALLQHFCELGWKEGRNPNAAFDTANYLLTHEDVARSGMNPFYHYLLMGEVEQRAVSPAARPGPATREALHTDPGDWVALLRPVVDVAYYQAQFGEGLEADPVAHFAYLGWLQGHDPNPHFKVRLALAERPELRSKRVNPLVAELVAPTPPRPPPADPDDERLHFGRYPRSELFGIGAVLEELRKESLANQPVMLPRSYADPVEAVVAEQFDSAYYLAAYPDVRAHGLDPVHHYCTLGWTERRNPTPWFDTSYYLAANGDVASHGLNPFWHYLVAGRAEGRKPQRPGGYRREIIDNAVDPDVITASYVYPEITSRLTRPRLERLLRARCKDAAGLVVSASHDCYIRVTGGIQLFIVEEQGRFAEQGLTYLHLSPYRALLRLADAGADDVPVNVVLDGEFLGVASYDDVAAALRKVPPTPGQRRMFVVHCLLGHHLQSLLAVHRGSAASSNLFWLHDYSAICVGYTLLRNDVAFCHAPPPDSMTCRVCVYGERRIGHLEQLRPFFTAIDFLIVAPCRAAMGVWLAHGQLPHLAATVHPHCELLPGVPGLPRPPGGPVRLAFIGYPRSHKGWPIWKEIVTRTRLLGPYEFIHFSSSEANQLLPGVIHHQVSTSPADPDAMSNALAEREVDLVLMLSTWPETFSFVTFEALAGGTDIVCLRDSGNVADMVRDTGRGVVAEDEAALVEFFTSLRAVHYVRLNRAQGTPRAQLVRNGTSATLAQVQTA